MGGGTLFPYGVMRVAARAKTPSMPRAVNPLTLKIAKVSAY